MLGYLISPVLQVENTDGKPLVGGRIVVYRHGTTEPYITYKDFEGTHNPAEVILDSKGMCILIAEEGYSYDVYCRDRNYVEQWSRIGISIGLGGTSIISRDGTITVKSAGGVVDLGISDNDVTVLTGTGAERGTDGNFSISKTASSGEGLEVTGSRIKVKKAGWYHIEATWYAQSNSTANGYRTVELSTRDSRTKLTLDLTVSSEQWRIIANDFYLHADEYIDFTLSGMGSDSAVRSWLQNVSIHRLTNIVGNPPDRVRPDWAEQDPNSPAYIFNKPNLAPVATTGSYEDLTDKPDLDVYATKVENATEGNLAALDADGNLVDSGEAAANVVHDANYVHTDNNYTTADKDKLAGIEAGAEVNVQADWTEGDSSKDSYIQNKPHVPTVSGDGTSISSIDGLLIYAASATMATQDGVGNNIVDTYGTKAEVSAKQDQLTAGTNVTISHAGRIDVKNLACSATNNSVAIGDQTNAYGNYGFTNGNRTSANVYAHAEGERTIASGQGAHSEGISAIAAGNRSHAEGESTVSSGLASHGEGRYTSAVAPYSHSEGYNTLAGSDYMHAEGQFNATSAGAILVVGNGTSDSNRSDALIVRTSGTEIPNNLTVGNNFIASGVNIIYKANKIQDSFDFLSNGGNPVVSAHSIVMRPVDENDASFTVSLNPNISAGAPSASFFNENYFFDVSDNIGNDSQRNLANISANKPFIIKEFNISGKCSNIFTSCKTDYSIENWGHFGTRGNSNYCCFKSSNLVSIPSSWEGYNAWPGANHLAAEQFAYTKISAIPTDYSNIPILSGESKSVYQMFLWCSELRSDVDPFMDWVLSAINNGTSVYVGQCFKGCANIPNYSTLSTDSTYSAFFQ